MSRRKTAKDYRKEYGDLIEKKIALEARIKKRAIELCKKFPNVKVSNIYSTESFCSGHYSNPDNFTSIDSYLNVIQKIEEHNEKQSGIVQTSMYGDK